MTSEEERANRAVMLYTQVLNMARNVYNVLGPGYSEVVYQNALEVELRKAGVPFDSQRPVPIEYAGHIVGELRADIVLLDKRLGLDLVVELKAKTRLDAGDRAQVKRYRAILSPNGVPGILINFVESYTPGTQVDFDIITEEEDA